jgi:hypothetical protein
MAVFLIREPRSVFIHIPKTGGASIRHGFFRGNVEGPVQGYVPSEWQPLFKFAFVRDPYDRVISAWRMFAAGMQNSVWQHPPNKSGISLKRFLQIATDERIPFNGHRDTTEEKIRHHAIPQTHPFNCLFAADFVGRFENLQPDFEQICRQLSIPSTELPHWNRTERIEDYQQYFDDEILAIIARFYAQDFETLGYPKIVL